MSDTQKQYSTGEGYLKVNLCSTSTTSDNLDWGQGNLDMKVGSFGSLKWTEDEFELELGDTANNEKVTSTFYYNGEDRLGLTTTVEVEVTTSSMLHLESKGSTTDYAKLTLDETSGFKAEVRNTSGGSSGHSTMQITPGEITIETSSMTHLTLN